MCVCEKECALSQSGYHYGQFTKEHLEAIKEGILLFNDQAYYECHEALEDLWLSDVGDNARLVYWAIIQVAAAMIHFREDNVIGARGLIKKAKDKNDSFRLMGFGHRVYKNFDPRAKIIKVAADNVMNKLGIDDPILDLAKKLEEIALKDQYFIDKKLYPNVDFYSGIIYRAIGFPPEMFTVMFALGRLPGWIAQWKEMRENKEPLGRPRQIYTGNKSRKYTDIGKR